MTDSVVHISMLRRFYASKTFSILFDLQLQFPVSEYLPALFPFYGLLYAVTPVLQLVSWNSGCPVFHLNSRSEVLLNFPFALPADLFTGKHPAERVFGTLIPVVCCHSSGQRTVTSFLFNAAPASCPAFAASEGFIRICTDSGLLRRYPRHCCFWITGFATCSFRLKHLSTG